LTDSTDVILKTNVINVNTCCQKCAQADVCVFFHYEPPLVPGNGVCRLLTSLDKFTVDNTKTSVDPSYIGGKCNPLAEVKNDPHFVGAEGTRFDFHGELNRSFCLLTDRDLHINMGIKGYEDSRMAVGGRRGISGVGSRGGGGKRRHKLPIRSWIRELYMTWRDPIGRQHSVFLKARDGKEQTRGERGLIERMVLDGRPLTPPTQVGQAVHGEGTFHMVLAAAGPMGDGRDRDTYRVRVAGVASMEISLHAAHPLLQTAEDSYTHFNVYFKYLNNTNAVHGVLGQTFRGEVTWAKRAEEYGLLTGLLRAPIQADGETGRGFLDGNVEDYATSAIDAADCAFATAWNEARKKVREVPGEEQGAYGVAEKEARGEVEEAREESEEVRREIVTSLLMEGPSAPPPGPLATTAAATAATAAPESCATMASLRVLALDQEGRPVAFDTWHDDMQLYLPSDSKDSVSLFDHASSAAPAPSATADSSTRSQWLSRDATARLAICNHLLVTECAHFGENRTTQALYDAVIARYSSPATAARGRLLLPYLFPELSAFATVADLVTHLRSSDARYRAALPAEFLPGNPPPMYNTLYFVVTRLPDSLRFVRDHFLTLDPTSLTVDLLEQHLLAAETSAVATSLFLRTSVLLQLVRSAAKARARVAGVVEEAAVVVEMAVGAVLGAAVEVVEAVEVVAAVGLVAALGALVAAVEAEEGVAAVEAVGLVVVGLDLGVEALVVVGASSSSVGERPSRPSSSTCGRPHTEHRCFARHDDAWRAEFGDDVERPRWAELLRSGVAIFDLDCDAILSTMYALSFCAEGDCYRCVPPDPGIAAAALGASASSTPPGTAPAEALHTFTLDSGASRYFFRDSTTLTPLPAPVPVRLADPSGDPVVARSSTVLPCPAVPSGSLSGLHLPSFSTSLVSTAALQDAMVTTTTPGGQRVSICMCTRTGRHLATFTCQPGSSLYTLATEPPQVAASAQVSALGQGSAPSGVSQVDPLPGIAPIQVAVGSGAAPGAASGGAETGGARSEGAGSRGAEPGGPAGASPRLTSQQLREWLVRRAHRRSGAPGAGGAGDTGVGGAAVATEAGGTGGTATTGPRGARTSGAGAAGTGGVGCARAGDPTEPGAAGAGGAGAGVAGVGGPGVGGAGAARAGGAGDTLRPRPYFVPLLQQVLGVPSSTSLTPPLLCPPLDQSQPPLQPASPLLAPSSSCQPRLVVLLVAQVPW
ncbi:unnamed protein product, partial [Closterium sp. NIES-54]